MSQSPLPKRIASLLKLGTEGNPALLFDRGWIRDESTKGWKEKWLQSFAHGFNSRDASEYEKFLGRRFGVLADLKARTIDRITQTRLVIGLGLPNPLETGFLFDRLTGCPYLPGSSVKGLLRATARFVKDGEIEGNKDFWTANLERVFGPEIEPGKTARTGEAIFYDAFPTAWPTLEVDVLTPHYKAYYGDKKGTEVPADWDNPNPVAFLTVQPGTTFRFPIQAPEKDAEELEKLLDLGLDWLGIGAKKSAGYGVMGLQEPVLPPRALERPTREEPAMAPKTPVRPPLGVTIWKNNLLALNKGAVVAQHGTKRAQCSTDLVERDLLSALKKGNEVRADVEVIKISGNEIRISRIKDWKT